VEGPSDWNSRPRRFNRDRLARCRRSQSAGITSRHRGEADGSPSTRSGLFLRRGFLLRTGQNWGQRAYFPRGEKSFTPEECWPPFPGTVSTTTSRRQNYVACDRGVRPARRRASR